SFPRCLLCPTCWGLRLTRATVDSSGRYPRPTNMSTCLIAASTSPGRTRERPGPLSDLVQEQPGEGREQHEERFSVLEPEDEGERGGGDEGSLPADDSHDVRLL